MTLVALAAQQTGASARDLFVGPSGADQGPGSSSAPFRTLGRAAVELRPGDVLHIRAGLYREPLVIARSGAPGAPITVRGEGRPLIEAKEDAVTVTGSYVRVFGLEAHSFGEGSAITIGRHNHHVLVENNILRDSGCGGLSALYTDYLTVRFNTAYGNGRRSPWQCSGLSLYHPEAYDQKPGPHNLFVSNLSYDNQNEVVDDRISHSGGRTTDGNGLIIDDGDHTQDPSDPPYRGQTLVIGNVVHDNGGRGIHVFHSANVLILANAAYDDLKDPNLQRPAGELSVAFSQNVSVVDNFARARPAEPPALDGYNLAPILWEHNLLVGQAEARLIQTPSQFGPERRMREVAFTLSPSGEIRFPLGSPALTAGVAFTLEASGRLALLEGRPCPVGPPAGDEAGARDPERRSGGP